MNPRSLAVAAFALSLPALALAHVGADGGSHHGAGAALLAGFTHPFTGPDHLAAMLAVGLWSGLTAGRKWLAPLAFVTVLLAGALLGLAGLRLPGIEPAIAASVLALGLLLATGAQLPAAAGVALAGAFALFHGAAHGQELAGPSAALALAGMVAGTALLHAAGIGAALAMRRGSQWMPRAAGAAATLFGASLLLQLA